MDDTEDKVKAKFDAAIKGNKARLEPLVAAMAQLRAEVIAPIVAFLKNYYDSDVRRFLEDEAPTAAKLSSDQIKQFKGEVQGLKDSAQEFISGRLADDRLWWHTNPFGRPPPPEFPSSSDYRESTHAPHGQVHSQIRIAMGRLGPILKKYGLSKNMHWHANSAGSLPAYPYAFDWSSDVAVIMQRYGAIHSQAVSILEDIQQLQNDYEKEITRIRWNAA